MNKFIGILLYFLLVSNLYSQNSKELLFKEIERKMEKVSIGKTIPDFYMSSPTNPKVKISDFKGKYLLIDFWATWCPPCMESKPYFIELEKKYEKNIIEFILISKDREFEDFVTYVSKNISNLNEFWISDEKENSFNDFLLQKMDMGDEIVFGWGIPKYVLISPNGTILMNTSLTPKSPEFEKKLNELID